MTTAPLWGKRRNPYFEAEVEARAAGLLRWMRRCRSCKGSEIVVVQRGGWKCAPVIGRCPDCKGGGATEAAPRP